MSDLISRSEVNDVIDELEAYTCGKPNTMKVEISVLQLQRLINKLKNISTAYSVDKVVEELEKSASRYTKKYATPHGNNGYKDIKAISIRKAIEIVKQSGVSDDVCEYENTDDEYCKWKINSVFPETINNPHIAERENIATTKYCPCCGKKIKIVGD